MTLPSSSKATKRSLRCLKWPTHGRQATGSLALNECLDAFPDQLGLLDPRLGQCHGLGKKLIINRECGSHGQTFASTINKCKAS